MNLKNLIRIGRVSSIDYSAGTVRVCFEDQDSIVTKDLPYLSFEYEMPEVGDLVLCVFLGNSVSKGFCLGRFFYSGDMPRDPGEGIYHKHFFDEGYIKYDKSAKTLTIYADKLNYEGDTRVVIESSGQVIVNAPDVHLGATGGAGVVTGECVCAFTGLPHPDVSSVVKAVK